MTLGARSWRRLQWVWMDESLLRALVTVSAFARTACLVPVALRPLTAVHAARAAKASFVRMCELTGCKTSQSQRMTGTAGRAAA